MPDEVVPYSPGQIRKAGDRIRRAAKRGEVPREADLETLNSYRAWHQPTLEACQRELVGLFHEQLAIDSETIFITGRPLKTVEAIPAKLVRSKTRLSTMQDIAGTRIVVRNLELQEAVSAVVLALFKDKNAIVAKDTRASGNDFGYRAMHVRLFAAEHELER